MNEKPLEKMSANNGMIRIFRRMGCIGDSLASGEFEYDDHGEKGFWDCYEYSWAQQIARAAGIEMANFARGGMTAREMYLQADAKTCTHEEVNHLFDTDHLKQGYIIALGVNDIKGENCASPIYSRGMGDYRTDICVSDYEKNADSIIGWYAKIIQRLQSLQPEAKFFLISLPNDERRVGKERYNEQLQGICKTLKNCYLVDLLTYGPVYDAEFMKKYFDGHMNAMGYLLTADLIMSYIDWIIRENWNEFVYVQFIGSGKAPFSDENSRLEQAGKGTC